jgi:hypothetical protein
MVSRGSTVSGFISGVCVSHACVLEYYKTHHSAETSSESRSLRGLFTKHIKLFISQTFPLVAPLLYLVFMKYTKCSHNLELCLQVYSYFSHPKLWSGVHDWHFVLGGLGQELCKFTSILMPYNYSLFYINSKRTSYIF